MSSTMPWCCWRQALTRSGRAHTSYDGRARIVVGLLGCRHLGEALILMRRATPSRILADASAALHAMSMLFAGASRAGACRRSARVRGSALCAHDVRSAWRGDDAQHAARLRPRRRDLPPDRDRVFAIVVARSSCCWCAAPGARTGAQPRPPARDRLCARARVCGRLPGVDHLYRGDADRPSRRAPGTADQGGRRAVVLDVSLRQRHDGDGDLAPGIRRWRSCRPAWRCSSTRPRGM